MLLVSHTNRRQPAASADFVITVTLNTQTTSTPGLLVSLVLALLPFVSANANAAAVRVNRPIDIELDRLGSLHGEIGIADCQPADIVRVLAYHGRQLMAEAVVTGDGGFRIDGLSGGVYWLSAPGTGRVVRAWAQGTAPPDTGSHLVLESKTTIIRGQAPAPAASSVPPMPAYPFQPYQVPGGGMMWPGTYTSPGAVFYNPLLTAAVVTGVVGVIVVAVDDDDDRPTSP